MTDKSTYFISYNVSTDELEGDLSIQCNPAGTGANKNLKFHPSTTDLSFLKTGNETFSIQKGSSFDTLKNRLLNGEQVNYPAKEFLSTAFSSRPIYDFNVNIKAIASTGSEPLSIFPNALKFHLDRSKGESKSKSVTLSVDSSTVNISAPYWLTVEAIGGNQIEVITANSATLLPGIYTGEVIISDSVNQVIVNVIINVIDAEIVNELEEYNFCLDAKKIYFKQYHPNLKYKRVKINGTQYISNEEHHIQQIYDLIYFNGETNIDIGEKVQQFIEPFKEILLDMALKKHIMKPISIQINIADLNDKFEELHQKSLGTFYFYPGKKPKAYPLLTNHRIRKRVNLSKMLISYIEGVAVPNTWGIFKSINNGAAYDISCLILTEYNLNFPKVFNFGTMKVISFPAPQNAFHIQWLNQNLVPEWATFTGEFKIKTAYHHTISKSVFTNKKKKYDSEKEKSLSINTGFILKAEIPMIEEMMSSSIVYIEMDNRLLKCIPNGEKLDSEDSTNQLVTFELEFLIISEIWK